MKRKTLFILLTLVFTINFYSADIDSLLRDGDELYRQREDISKAILALEKYKAALKFKPDSFTASWKIAKTTHYLVDELKSEKEQKLVINTGIKAAKKAINLKPNRMEGYFWLGVNYAKEGQVKGVLKSLFRISPVKKNMRKVLEIDERYEGGGAYIVLGRVYSQVPGILGGSNRKAEKNLLKAMKICRTNPLTYLFLAEVYEDTGRSEKAIELLGKLEKMEVDPRWIPETKKKKEEGRKYLKKLIKSL